MAQRGRHLAPTIRRISRTWVIPLTLVMTLVLSGVAIADDLKVDLDAQPTATTITEGDSTTASYLLTAQRDSGEPTTGQPVCNASSVQPVSVTIAASPATGLSISPNPFQLTGCGGGNGVVVTLTGDQPGVYNLTASTSGGTGGAITVTQAAWTLTVEEDTSTPTDVTPPVITCDVPSPGPIFLLGELNAEVPATLVDETDPTSQALSMLADTSSVGHKTVTFNGSDAAGNVADPVACPYWVQFDWTGFFAPVENPSAWNSAKAGQSIPVKFSLAGDQGLNIFAAGFPQVTQIACPSNGTVTDPIEEYATATANSKLIYDGSEDQYNYVWKTDKAWGGKCLRLDVKLMDGTIHSANFKFTK